MKLPHSHTLGEVAAMIHAKPVGDPEFRITGINEINVVEAGDITFVNVEKYYKKALSSKATTIIINKEVPCPAGKTLLISEDPYRDFTFICKYYRPTAAPHPQAVFIKGENVTIGSNSRIHHGVVLGNNVTIGDNCIIYPNTVIYDHCAIGNNVIIHANTTIGGDAFYYSSFQKMHSCGDVRIADHVEIGAGCAIDRGVTATTSIGAHTKLDNLVHIAHDVSIGEYCIIAAQVAIAGAATVGNRVTMWGKVGVTKGISVADGTIVLGAANLAFSTKQGGIYFGTPAKERDISFSELRAIGKLPALLEKLK